MSFSKAKRFSYSQDFPERNSRGSNGGGNSSKQNLNRTFTKDSPSIPTAQENKIPPKFDNCNTENEYVAFADSFEKFQEDFDKRRKSNNLTSHPRVEPFHLNNGLGILKRSFRISRSSQPDKKHSFRLRGEEMGEVEETTKKLISKTVEKIVTENEIKIRATMESITDFNFEAIRDLNQELSTVIKGTVKGNKEEDFGRLISLLLRQIEDGKCYTEFLERNYVRILQAAHKEIEEQAAVIEALRAEIDATEMNRKIKNIWKK